MTNQTDRERKAAEAAARWDKRVATMPSGLLPSNLRFQHDDGGRAAAGYKGTAGDCGCRALAIASGMTYQDAYDAINEAAKAERPGARARGTRSSSRTGVYSSTMRRLMADLGWEWVSKMSIGSGCTTHLRSDELPTGRLIARLSKHYVAVIDGVIHDTSDPSREGTRCVYGYWTKEF